jgi:hypothetical protein
MSSLQQLLPHPVDEETEKAFLEVLQRKVSVVARNYVDKTSRPPWKNSLNVIPNS